MTNMLTPLVSE